MTASRRRTAAAEPTPRVPRALRRASAVALTLVACGGGADAPTPPRATPPGGEPPREWTLAWSDEFDGPAGAPADGARWVAETGGHGWGNQERQYYTARAENVSLDGAGRLVIT